MRDGRPNPDIWGNIITCGEIAVGIYEIVGTKKRGLEVPKAVAEDPQAAARLDAIRQLDDVTYDTAFEPPVSDYELDGLDLER